MSFAKRLFLFFHEIYLRRRVQARLRAMDFSRPRVFYAFSAPSKKERASGGAIKLAYLSTRFPEASWDGNILYLVSSALPRSALAWARAAKEKGALVVLNQNGVAYPAWATASEMERINKRNIQLAELADHILFQSEFCRTAFAEWVGRVPNSHSVLYNPVDTEHFVPGDERAREFDLLLVGSVAQPARVKLPLEAAKLALAKGKKWKIRIAGKLHWAGAEAELEAWIQELGLTGQQVVFSGAYSQEEAPLIYQSAKVLVHMQDKDASPTVPIEALACATPVVACQSGGLPELLSPETGKLLPVQRGWQNFYYPSAEDIFRGAELCLASRERMGEAGRGRVKDRFSLAEYLRKHEELFSKLVADRKK